MPLTNHTKPQRWRIPATALASALLAALAWATPAVAQPANPHIELNYSDAQYQKTATIICRRLDRFKTDTQIYPLRQPKMCTALPKGCEAGKKYIGPRGIVRYSADQILKVGDAALLEAQLPAIINKLSTFSCAPSSHKLLGEPLHEVRRNIVKRAVFLGQTTNFFNRFIFKDYEYQQQGHRRLGIDINAVELVEGQPETLLDYLDTILAPTHKRYLGKAGRDDVEALRYSLIKRGAVRARDLDCAPGQQIYCPLKR